MNTTTKMILGITVAAAAGAAIGMLIAPEKGTDLQKKIKEGATDWLHEFSGLIGLGKQMVTELKSLNINGLTSEMIDLDEHEKTTYQRPSDGTEKR
jgi:gas vesicle protein